MKFSTRSRYGLRAVIELAEHGELTKMSLHEIAEQQNISLRYLEQLFSTLKKSGYVNGLRGAYGGYTLAKKPNEISVGEIIRALEGCIAPVACVCKDNSHPCDRARDCRTRPVWVLIRDKLNDTIDNIKISDLVNKHNNIKLE